MQEQFKLLSKMTNKISKAEIVTFEGNRDVVERLQELGIRVGFEIFYFGKAPFNGPLMFRVASTVLALREEEAECVIIKII